jgi:hypothetical protein
VEEVLAELGEGDLEEDLHAVLEENVYVITVDLENRIN